jgi:hypothetical protein
MAKGSTSRMLFSLSLVVLLLLVEVRADTSFSDHECTPAN